MTLAEYSLSEVVIARTPTTMPTMAPNRASSAERRNGEHPCGDQDREGRSCGDERRASSFELADDLLLAEHRDHHRAECGTCAQREEGAGEPAQGVAVGQVVPRTRATEQHDAHRREDEDQRREAEDADTHGVRHVAPLLGDDDTAGCGHERGTEVCADLSEPRRPGCARGSRVRGCRRWRALLLQGVQHQTGLLRCEHVLGDEPLERLGEGVWVWVELCGECLGQHGPHPHFTLTSPVVAGQGRRTCQRDGSPFPVGAVRPVA